MAQYQKQSGAVPQKDEYGNPIRQSDEYGNPIQQHHTGTTGEAFGTGGHGTGMQHGGAPAGTDIFGGHQKDGSSSEEDGQGGRRKKGLTEKIKEKMPGGGPKADQSHCTPNTTTPYGQGATGLGQGATGQEQEKKGVMDKIKEKIPGQHPKPGQQRP